MYTAIKESAIIFNYKTSAPANLPLPLLIHLAGIVSSGFFHFRNVAAALICSICFVKNLLIDAPSLFAWAFSVVCSSGFIRKKITR